MSLAYRAGTRSSKPMAESTADETVRISVNSNDEGMSSADEKKEEKIKTPTAESITTGEGNEDLEEVGWCRLNGINGNKFCIG